MQPLRSGGGMDIVFAECGKAITLEDVTRIR